MDIGEKITAEIIALVMKTIPQPPGESDLEATMRGIACAYTAFAYAFHTQDEAKELLVRLADALDDQPTLAWALTAGGDVATMEDAPKGSVTPKQLIAMLDNMQEVGFCEKRIQKGQQVYILSVDDIYECDDILAGYYLKE